MASPTTDSDGMPSEFSMFGELTNYDFVTIAEEILELQVNCHRTAHKHQLNAEILENYVRKLRLGKTDGTIQDPEAKKSIAKAAVSARTRFEDSKQNIITALERLLTCTIHELSPYDDVFDFKLMHGVNKIFSKRENMKLLQSFYEGRVATLLDIMWARFQDIIVQQPLDIQLRIRGRSFDETG
ncbi:unnamed protein product [Periconia digitata]|uniref:Uncharacterized protein n=1 Tax=Periconia digitata TaxID=1303443 RepID=A0A9W4US82_9PLEO|nr:unnamed protein product [Periconia digitata]